MTRRGPLWLLAFLCLGWLPAGAGEARHGGSPAVESTAGSAPAADPAAPIEELCRAGGSREPAASERAARRLAAALPPAALERELESRPDLAAAALPVLGGVLARTDGAFAADLGNYLAAAARERAARLARALSGSRGSASPTDDGGGAGGAAGPDGAGAERLGALRALLVLDPARFAAEAGFRARLLAGLPAVFDGRSPALLREAVLTALDGAPGLDFAEAERLAVAWGVARRASAARRQATPQAAPGAGTLRFAADDDPIEASVYSLPSSRFPAAAAARLLAAVHAAAPRRRLVVLADLAQRLELAPLVAGWRVEGDAAAGDPAAGTVADQAVELLDTWGRPFSPWPRDPMSLARDGAGGLVVLMRPNVQAGRDEDQHLGLALVDMLPPALDRAWGGGAAGVRWSVARVPFHNGQVLMTRQAAWITIHTLEPRILALLGLGRVPVESFATAAGIARYAAAARRAAAELAELYGRPVRFAHPMPDDRGDLGASPTLMQRLGGGAGYDLDSLLTLLPAAADGGRPVALVASVAAGRRLLEAADEADLRALAEGYGLAAPRAAGEAAGGGEAGGLGGLEGLRTALVAAAQGRRPGALDAFLDLVADHLATQGFDVRRLPIVSVPTGLLAGRHLSFSEFLITWNNVVIEWRQGALRAEGFAALLPSGDAAARAAFAAAGCRLDLLPPLVESVVFNGGYRCASNQLRLAAAAREGPPPGAPTRGARSRRR